jgi:lipid-binding SYLF domain-containing protein
MKKLLLSLLLLGFIAPAFALTQSDLDNQVLNLAAKFDTMQRKPGKAIPASTLAKAQGIVLLDRTKAGLVFAYQGGRGVALVKNADGAWSPPAFLSANEASLGLQIGGEQNFFVILLMNTNALVALTDSNIDFGGEARGTGGNKTKGKDKSFMSPDQSVIVYSDRTGAFGAAAIKGGVIGPDSNANVTYYQQVVSMGDILFDKKVAARPSATDLANKITDYSKEKPEVKSGS